MRVVVRTVSELCITVGTVIVLFVVYVLFWTGVKADDVMGEQIDQLQDQWSKGSVQQPTGGAPSGVPEPTAYKSGKPFAIMYIPRLGFTWNKPVLEGTAVGTLKKGLGHYTRTARLGEKGNFSVAGHRRTYGDPFKDFPKLRRGDAVVLTDGTTWFTYRIDKGPYKTVPTDVEVIDPVPRKSGYTRSGRYLTLTTCDPEWGHSHRLIVWAHLDSTQPVEEGKPTALRR
ncbi:MULTISPECIES: class E sortase [unclassified Streptomyces]|uniref:class E sortase n=1 Tax=unclassified Streptomyces TaxID=2593676 RepID=UPI0022570CF3|nr:MULTISPECIES: class E sortase [unclassified Streptomyces]MCX5332844.1 class E sortase [Streptomyces sp. NBC_00140]MCX5362242.1 class E sortase [Streptomyces sp. NBC_00124]